MRVSFVEFEGDKYRLVFGDPSTDPVPTAVFRIGKDGAETPTPGTVWATILFEGIPVD